MKSNNYFLIKKDHYLLIIEKESNFVIKSCANKKKALNLREHLNSGGGFDGLTPPFFINKKEQIK